MSHLNIVESSELYQRSQPFRQLPEVEMESSAHILKNYPEVNIIYDASQCDDNEACSSNSWQNVLQPVYESSLKRIVRTFWESGFSDALNEARSNQISDDNNALISAVAELIFQVMEFYKRIKLKIFPNRKEKTIQCVAKYSETRNWINSSIRFIAWHPNCFKLAVAGGDDIVRIYTDKQAKWLVLRRVYQKWITCMAWRPFTVAELAVGCQKGICLWTKETPLAISCLTYQMVLLTHPNHYPITSIQWTHDGTLLASASISDTDVIIWDVDKGKNTALKRVGPPCSLLKMAPNGGRLFAASVANVFRLWACDNSWQPERWTITHGTIQSACWSPCSRFMLFVTSEDTLLYRLTLFQVELSEQGCASKKAWPIVDFGDITSDNYTNCNQPQSIAWCPNGLYLAVTFKYSPEIAIFTTSIQRYNLIVSSLCFLVGRLDEYPSSICFQSKNRENSKSVLTVAWSSGRLTFYPLIDM